MCIQINYNQLFPYQIFNNIIKTKKMQYENKILNFHIYLYFPSNIFKKFKNIKIKRLTYYILTCIISLVFTRNKSKHTIQYARVAQWWSTSLPRRVEGSIPVSRSVEPTKGLPNGKSFFIIREVQGTSRRATASQFGFDFSER